MSDNSLQSILQNWSFVVGVLLNNLIVKNNFWNRKVTKIWNTLISIYLFFKKMEDLELFFFKCKTTNLGHFSVLKINLYVFSSVIIWFKHKVYVEKWSKDDVFTLLNKLVEPYPISYLKLIYFRHFLCLFLTARQLVFFFFYVSYPGQAVYKQTDSVNVHCSLIVSVLCITS